MGIDQFVNSSSFDPRKGAFSALDFGGEYASVAVIGLFNKGKTHVVNNLAGVLHESDKKIHTKGLSFSHSKKEGYQVLFIDTAGSNSPLDGNSVIQLEKEDLDEQYILALKRTTEMFLQTLAFSLADIMIVVVNEITWPDQEFIKGLQDKLSSADRSNKQLIVIHNFSDVTEEADLLFMWKKWVISLQKGVTSQDDAVFTDQQIGQDEVKMKSKSCVFFTEEMGTGKDKVFTYHYCLAKEGSPAGIKYNSGVYNSINQKILNHKSQKAPLEDLLSKNICNTLQYYCKEPEDFKLTLCDGDEKVEKYIENSKPLGEITAADFKNALPISDPVFPGTFKITVGGDLSLKADKVLYDGFRITLTQTENAFLPKYDIIDHEKYISVIIDVPGVLKQGDAIVREEVLNSTSTSSTSSQSKGIPRLGHKADSKTTDCCISFDIERSDQFSYLRIYGERKRLYVDIDLAKPKDFKLRPYDGKVLSGLNTHKRNDFYYRPESKFNFTIQLPVQVTDKNVEIIPYLSHGVYILIIPKKVDGDSVSRC